MHPDSLKKSVRSSTQLKHLIILRSMVRSLQHMLSSKKYHDTIIAPIVGAILFAFSFRQFFNDAHSAMDLQFTKNIRCVILDSAHAEAQLIRYQLVWHTLYYEIRNL